MRHEPVTDLWTTWVSESPGERLERRRLHVRSRSCLGQPHPEGRCRPRGGVDADLAAVRRHERRDDRQAQAGAAGGAGPRGVRAVEPLEDACGVLRSEARAAVAHREVHLAGPDRDPTSTRGARRVCGSARWTRGCRAPAAAAPRRRARRPRRPPCTVEADRPGRVRRAARRGRRRRRAARMSTGARRAGAAGRAGPAAAGPRPARPSGGGVLDAAHHPRHVRGLGAAPWR